MVTNVSTTLGSIILAGSFMFLNLINNDLN